MKRSVNGYISLINFVVKVKKIKRITDDSDEDAIDLLYQSNNLNNLTDRINILLKFKLGKEAELDEIRAAEVRLSAEILKCDEDIEILTSERSRIRLEEEEKAKQETLRLQELTIKNAAVAVIPKSTSKVPIIERPVPAKKNNSKKRLTKDDLAIQTSFKAWNRKSDVVHSTRRKCNPLLY
jgi:hypothetical protein